MCHSNAEGNVDPCLAVGRTCWDYTDIAWHDAGSSFFLDVRSSKPHEEVERKTGR